MGSIAQLGSWDPCQAIELNPNIYYEYIYNPPQGEQQIGPKRPVWTGVVTRLPSQPSFEWKCIRLNHDGSGEPSWQPGPNNVFQAAKTSGYAGQVKGSL